MTIGIQLQLTQTPTKRRIIGPTTPKGQDDSDIRIVYEIAKVTEADELYRDEEQDARLAYTAKRLTVWHQGVLCE
jgi:hypothetical protein